MKKHRKKLADQIVETLKVYAKTQLLVFAVITAVTWIILTLLGVRYALILAFVTGAFSAVPFFGITIAAVLAAAVAIGDGVRFSASGV